MKNETPFDLMVLTHPRFFAGEAALLQALLEAGLQRLHLRKPGARDAELARLIDRIPEQWHQRLVIHQHESLLCSFSLGGIHCPLREAGRLVKRSDLKVSVSLHRWEELAAVPLGTAYGFFSPLFDSISKKGYRANDGLWQRPPAEIPCPAIGLGGIHAGNIGQVVDHGWDGAAILGYLWETPGEAPARYHVLQDQLQKSFAHDR